MADPRTVKKIPELSSGLSGPFRPESRDPMPAPFLGEISMIRVNKRLRTNPDRAVKISLLAPEVHDRFPRLDDNSNGGF
jgi:hypothetical protein